MASISCMMLLPIRAMWDVLGEICPMGRTGILVKCVYSTTKFCILDQEIIIYFIFGSDVFCCFFLFLFLQCLNCLCQCLYKTCQCTHVIFNDGNVIWLLTAVKAWPNPRHILFPDRNALDMILACTMATPNHVFDLVQMQPFCTQRVSTASLCDVAESLMVPSFSPWSGEVRDPQGPPQGGAMMIDSNVCMFVTLPGSWD